MRRLQKTLKCTICGIDFKAAHNRKIPICAKCHGNKIGCGPEDPRQIKKAKSTSEMSPSTEQDLGDFADHDALLFAPISESELEQMCIDVEKEDMDWRKGAWVWAPGDSYLMKWEFKVPTEIFKVPITKCRDCGSMFDLPYGTACFMLRCTKCEKTRDVQTVEAPSKHNNYLSINEENKLEADEAKFLSLEEFFHVIEKSAGKCECGGEFRINSPYSCPNCHSTNIEDAGIGTHRIVYRLRENAAISKKRHNERCPKCKQTIKDMLCTVFNSDVITNWDTGLSCRLEEYINTDIADVLGPIYEALQKHRGHNNFVQSSKLSRADYFVISPGFIIEFDESQHFTKPRDVALSLYPPESGVNFSVKKWRRLCQELDKHDNDPEYRDEQRAWYDTLRDLAPTLLGHNTYRLYTRDEIWCSLNPEDRSDLIYFKHKILYGRFRG